MENLDVIKPLIDLGSIAMLMYFLFVVWKDRKEIIKEKDDKIHELNGKIMDIVVQNTRVQSELRDSIKQNTKATETLTNYIYESLRK